MMKTTLWRIVVVVWALFVTLVLICKVQEPEPVYIELPAPVPRTIYKTETVEVEVGQKAYYADIAASITENEREMLAKATYLEAGNQSITGQRAVVEVILNRVMNDEFPDTIEEVLYQPGQFTTAPQLASVTPGEEQYRAVDLTLETSAPILEPYVLFFATGLPDWQTKYEKIGAHYFGYREGDTT